MGLWGRISGIFGKKEEKRENKGLEEFVSGLYVPWEKDIPAYKRRYYVHDVKEGGMGRVYLVLDKEEGMPLAIKTFKDKYLESKEAIERFKREAEVWIELGKHKNIVRAYYVRTFLGRPYIFMEWVVGHEQYGASLFDWIIWGAIDLSLMVNFAIQFCRGMNYAEKRFKEMGRIFVHRDIKPSNILVTRDKVIKITDFGLAQTLREETIEAEIIGDKDKGRYTILSRGGICGTPFYMSPEQILQDPKLLKDLGVLKEEIEPPILDIRSDIYSFGCVLYAMVKREPPFVGSLDTSKDWAKYFYKTLYEEPDGFESGDRGFDEIIKRCLRKSPDKRFSNFLELEEALQGVYKRLTGERLREETPEEFEAWELNNRGVSFSELGRYERAIEDFNRALEINPRYALAYNNRGAAYAKKGDLDRAISDFNRAIEINPGYADAYVNRGLAYYNKGDLDRAIFDFNRALEINPRDVEAYVNRGAAYADKGDLDGAISDFNRAIEINPGYALAYNNRGLAYYYKGDLEKACLDAKRACELGICDLYQFLRQMGICK